MLACAHKAGLRMPYAATMPYATYATGSHLDELLRQLVYLQWLDDEPVPSF
jgi:hypothetical protein